MWWWFVNSRIGWNSIRIVWNILSHPLKLTMWEVQKLIGPPVMFKPLNFVTFTYNIVKTIKDNILKFPAKLSKKGSRNIPARRRIITTASSSRPSSRRLTNSDWPDFLILQITRDPEIMFMRALWAKSPFSLFENLIHFLLHIDASKQ